KSLATDGDVVLKLVRDDVPIRGRILDIQGRPISGVAVRVTQINTPKPGADLDAMLATGECDFDKLQHWYQVPTSVIAGKIAKSDADGHFEIRGMGRDRIVGLMFESPSTQTINVYAMSRSANTLPKPRPQPQPRGTGVMRVIGRQQVPVLFGSAVEVIAGPTK